MFESRHYFADVCRRPKWQPFSVPLDVTKQQSDRFALGEPERLAFGIAKHRVTANFTELLAHRIAQSVSKREPERQPELLAVDVAHREPKLEPVAQPFGIAVGKPELGPFAIAVAIAQREPVGVAQRESIHVAIDEP